MRKLCISFILIVFLFIFIGIVSNFTQPVFAASFNIDFGNLYGPPDDSYGAAANQTGHWNTFATTSPIVITDIDSDTTATLDVDALSWGHAGSGTSNDDDLLHDFFYEGGNPWQVTVSGLPKGLYNIYYYCPTHSGVSTGRFDINSLVANSLFNDQDTLIQGTSWDVVAGVNVDNTGLLTLVMDSSYNDGAQYHGLAGLQIVSAPVPIPGALWLLGSGLFGLVAVRRRKKS